MRVILLPFFSQQDKGQHKFRLDSDSGIRLYAYIAERMVHELGWHAALVLPKVYQCVGELPSAPHIKRLSYDACIDNLDRRLQWQPPFLREIGGADLVLTQHEFLPYPLRCLCPKLKVIVECGIRNTTAYPETAELFKLSYAAADAIHFNSETLAMEHSHPRKLVWKFGYHESIKPLGLERPIDVVFPGRTSVTGYTRHELFIRAMQGSKYYVRMTDPTGHLRIIQPDHPFLVKEPLTRTGYVGLLQHCKVVVSLATNGYAPYAFQEAVASGCVAVCPRTPEYVEVLTNRWPYYCELNEESVRDTVGRALRSVPNVATRIGESSYASAWASVKRDLQEVHDDLRVRRTGQSR